MQTNTAKLLLPEVVHTVLYTLTGSLEPMLEDQPSVLTILLDLVSLFFSQSRREYDSESVRWFFVEINKSVRYKDFIMLYRVITGHNIYFMHVTR